MSEEHRKYPRKEIQVDVELMFTSDGPCQVKTHDVSEGGMFLLMDNPEHYPLGEMVQVHFNDPLADGENTSKDGVIVRVADTGIAISYIEMDSFSV